MQRVFAEIFKGSAIAGIAHQIHAAGEHDVETLGARLAADHPAAGTHQLKVPGRTHRERGRQRCGTVVPAAQHPGHAQAGIGFLERRHIEPWNTGYKSGTNHGAGRDRRGIGEGQCHDAKGEYRAFLGAHLRHHGGGTSVGVGCRWCCSSKCGGRVGEPY